MINSLSFLQLTDYRREVLGLAIKKKSAISTETYPIFTSNWLLSKNCVLEKSQIRNFILKVFLDDPCFTEIYMVKKGFHQTFNSL